MIRIVVSLSGSHKGGNMARQTIRSRALRIVGTGNQLMGLIR